MRGLVAVLLLASLTLITLDHRGGPDGIVGRVRGAVLTVTSPLQAGLSSVTASVADLVARGGRLLALEQRNAALEAELADLRRRTAVVADLEAHNDRLRRLVGMRERVTAPTVAARVAAWSPSVVDWSLTLDVGTADGVAAGMPVVAADGLVGRVRSATPHAAQVVALADPSFSAAAHVAGRRGVAVVSGRGDDRLRLRLLDPATPVAVGDRILTSAFRGGTYPDGIPVGTVEEVGDLTPTLEREVVVRPAVELRDVDVVLVVGAAPTDPPLHAGGAPIGADR